jgi:plastocyanin/sugar lactone lactonase YvrE
LKLRPSASAHTHAVVRLSFALALFFWTTLLGASLVAAQGVTEVQVYASGLVNPKGLAFTADGTLYVAEAGKPGDVMVPLPVNFGGQGPIGTNARISRVPPGGQRQDFITNLPNIGLYGGVEMLGATGLAILNGQLYEVAAGHMTVSPKLSRLASDGGMTTVADVGAFNHANPAPPDNGDAVPMGNPFGMAALDGSLYITDGNYNRILKATPDGAISVLADFDNDPTSVGIAAGPDGNLYVAQFGLAPYTSGTGRVDRVTPSGAITDGVVRQLTTAIGVAFAPDGTMYTLEFASEFSPERLRYIPFGGQVRRVEPDGTTRLILTNLVFPTSMVFGPDGALYVTNYGNESNEGQGQVLRIVPRDQPARGPDVPITDDSRSYAFAQPTLVAKPEDATTIAATVHIVEPAEALQWGYEPRQVTIQTGQAVVFTNDGRIFHTATHTEGVFDTGLLKGGESTTIRFDEPGTYAFFCQPHPWMRATITVQG